MMTVPPKPPVPLEPPSLVVSAPLEPPVIIELPAPLGRSKAMEKSSRPRDSEPAVAPLSPPAGRIKKKKICFSDEDLRRLKEVIDIQQGPRFDKRRSFCAT